MLASFKNGLQRIIYLIVLQLSINIGCAQPQFLKPEIDINNGLKSNIIRVIQKCPINNSIWLGTEGGLAILNNSDTSFNKLITTIKNTPVWAISFFKNTAIIGTWFNGIYFFDLTNKSITHHLDTSKVGLCRRFKIINDTVFIASTKAPFYLINSNNKWILKRIKIKLSEGFITDFTKFNNTIYATAYARFNSKLLLFENDTLVPDSINKIFDNQKYLDYFLSLTSSDSLLVLGGALTYSIFTTNKNRVISKLVETEKEAALPVWDAVISKDYAYLATGGSENLQEGTICEPLISKPKEYLPNFYGQSLYYDSDYDIIWCGTLNRGLFLWRFANETYKSMVYNSDINNIKPITKNSLVHYGNKKIVIQLLGKSLLKGVSKSVVFDFAAKDVLVIKDSLIALSANKLVIYIQKKKVWEYNLPLSIYNKISYLQDRIVLLSQYNNEIMCINLKSKESTITKTPCNLTTNQPYKNGFIYFSNYSGFYYYDTIPHYLNLPFLSVESFTILNNTLFFIERGLLYSYKINTKNYNCTPIYNTSFQKLIPEFTCKWILNCANKLYAVNNKGILEMNPKNGLPIRYIYLGNYTESKEPKAFEKYIFLNNYNYITRINIDSTHKFIPINSVITNVFPSKSIDEKTSFSIKISSADYLVQNHSLKRIDVYKKDKLVQQFYTLDSSFNITGGFNYGNYTIKVFINNQFIQAVKLKINQPLNSNPFFYISITTIILLFGFLVFKILLNKRAYEKNILQNRLQLLKQNLNPHFIFNSLNLIYSLVLQQKTEAAIKTITQFSDLHRYYLDNINKNTITLEEELSFIESYLKLESARVQSDDTLSYCIPVNSVPEIKSMLVPPMLLQPLVENAVKYSYGNINTKRCIWIDLIQNKNAYIIGIENTLSQSASIITTGNGLGVKMVQERVEIFNKTYKKGVKLILNTTTLHTDNGYRCELVFPLL